MSTPLSVCRVKCRIVPVSAHSSANLVRRSNPAISLCHALDPGSKRNAAGRTFCSAGVCSYEGDASETHSLAKEERIGVLLLNLGGPETLHDVQPFLFNLFADPVWPSTLLFFVFDVFYCLYWL